jgi:diguanylate cyclase (GGDEF)-like protein/PAS domain S-box-containing protein
MPENFNLLHSSSYYVSGYDYTLVVLSVVIAMLTAYTAADISWRASTDDGGKIQARWSWLSGIVLGLGAWGAHLIGMLAAKAHFSFTYKIDITVISILLVLAGSVSALLLVCRRGKRRSFLLTGGMLMGLGLVAMCFTGMHAVLMPGMQHTYNYGLVALSYAVAAGVSTLALLVIHKFYYNKPVNPGWEKVVFSILMAGAIIGMHYIDMASMQMTTLTMPAGMDMAGMPGMEPDAVGNNAMAAAVSAAVAIIVLVALWSSHQYYRSSLREKNLLQDAKEYTDSILRNILDGIVIIDERGLIQSLNPAAEHVFDCSDGEIIGKNISVLMPEPHRSQHNGYMHHYLKTGVGKVIGIGFREVEGLRKDGTVFPLEISVSDVRFGKRRLFAGLVRDITQRKEAEARLVHLAHYDALTGLPTRSLFRDRASQALLHADRTEQLMAILYLDLDHFKDVNDRLGHDVGDSLLKAVAQRTIACLRGGDTVSRLGGDEFVIILENLINTHDATSVAKKIIEALAEPFQLDSHEIRIGASIGVVISPFDHKDLDGLLKDADAAMYRAKSQGRNNFQLYSPDMVSGARSLKELEEDVGKAFVRDELRVYYQRGVALLTGKISNIEALLRWQHPKHGLLEAHEFVSLLEENGQIDVVGEWVLRTACTQFRAWLDAGQPLVRLVVNLSTGQLRDANLVKLVSRILEETRLPADCLELDIPGSYFDLSRDALYRGRVEELKKFGVHLALEDSCTRYSFIEFLNRSQLDTLKLDRDFVRGVHVDQDRAAVLKALIAMARALKLKVIAKGVESEEELALLREYRCDAVQGYLFGRVESAESLSRLFLQQQSQNAKSEIPSNPAKNERSPLA